MSDPKKHHYLPEFYLKRWAGEDSKVTEFSRPRCDVVTKRKSPSATGFQRELYTIHSRSHPSERQEVEKTFMSHTDNVAAEALSYIETHRTRPSDKRLRDGWSRFLMSLMHRSPQRIAWLRKMLREREKSVIADVQSSYSEARGPDDPDTFAEYLASAGSQIFDEALAALLIQIIDSKAIGNALNSMTWGVCRLSGHRFSLLTSDAPLLISNALGHPDASIILPIAPDSFFIAANRTEIIDSFGAQAATDISRAMNIAVVGQAEWVVVGSDASQLTLVENRFLRNKRHNRNPLELAVWSSPLMGFGDQ